MDLERAARLLDVSSDTVRRWVRQGLFPPAGPDGVSVDEEALERWAAEKGLTLGAEVRPNDEPADDLLAAAVERGAVTDRVRAQQASEAIAAALAALPSLAEADRSSLLDQILDRERLASTALGNGVAVPHPRTPPRGLVTHPTVSVLFPEEPIDWAALDGGRVHAVFLLLSPSAPDHLQLLSRIAFVLRQPGFSDLLRERPTKARLAGRLREIKKPA